jgi:CubicO group peptidase (beta-lactamase class C family)
MVHGTVATGFQSVRAAFERCFAEQGETGAAFVALVNGRPVADLWGGEGFARDALVHVYSVTKPMSAFCVLVLVDRGVLGLDEKMTRYWPEFGQARKEHTTVRQALSHQAGLPSAVDLLLGEEITWGLGVGLDFDGYGMGGLGGSLGWADPSLGLAEAYVTRQMGNHERAEAVHAAVRAVCGAG